MHKAKILFTTKFNEMSTTKADPYKVWTDELANQIDLEETDNKIWSNDDWRLVSCKIWHLSEVELPNWCSAQWYVDNHIKFKYFDYLANQYHDSDALTTEQAFKLMKLSTAQKMAALSLLKVKKFRSDFRKSLRKQLDKWLSATDNKYNSPFSFKQWDCLISGHIANSARYFDRYGLR